MANEDKTELILFRLDSIDENVGKLFTLIEGNGTIGIKDRLAIVEACSAAQESRWKWIFGIIAVVAAAFLVSLIV